MFLKKSLKINILKTEIIEVKDHCHYTDEYRGAAHNICNPKYTLPKKFQ